MSQSDSNALLSATNLFNVNGLIAVITGGGSGLGAMMARALALNGASKVFILGRREEKLKEVASSIPNPSTIIPIIADVTSKTSLTSAVDQIKSTHNISAMDVLVANSGVPGPDVPFLDSSRKPLPLEKLVENMWTPSAEDITQTYAVNLTGTHLTISAFLPLLAEANARRPQPPSPSTFRPRPQIITISSMAAYDRQPFSNLSYGPSKAGLVQMTKMLATALVPYDIRANVIAPGPYLSEMTQDGYQAMGKAEGHNVEGTWEREEVPATRTGDELDMAGVILWLCSRAGAYVNGNVVVTDGGRLSVLPATY